MTRLPERHLNRMRRAAAGDPPDEPVVWHCWCERCGRHYEDDTATETCHPCRRHGG